MSQVHLFSLTRHIWVIPGQSDHQQEPLEAENHGTEPKPHRVAAVVVGDDLVTKIKPIHDGGREDIDTAKEEPKQMNNTKNIVETLEHFAAVDLSEKIFYEQWRLPTV